MALLELLIIALLLSIVFLVIAFFNYARALEEKVDIAINSLQARAVMAPQPQNSREESEDEEVEEAEEKVESGEEEMGGENEESDENSHETISIEEQDSQRKRFYEELNRARNKTRAITEKAKKMRQMLEG